MEPDKLGGWGPGPALSTPPTCPSGWGRYSRGLAAAAWEGVGGGLGEPRVLTKQMPACRRGTRVHTLVGRQRPVTTVTLSCCRIWGGGWFVPSWPQPMATHCTPSPTPWSWAGNRATCTLALRVAILLSCRGGLGVWSSHGGGAVSHGCDSGAGFPHRGSTIVLGCLRAGCPPSACLPSSLTFPICKAGGTTLAEATSLDMSFFFLFYVYLLGCTGS